MKRCAGTLRGQHDCGACAPACCCSAVSLHRHPTPFYTCFVFCVPAGRGGGGRGVWRQGGQGQGGGRRWRPSHPAGQVCTGQGGGRGPDALLCWGSAAACRRRMGCSHGGGGGLCKVQPAGYGRQQVSCPAQSVLLDSWALPACLLRQVWVCGCKPAPRRTTAHWLMPHIDVSPAHRLRLAVAAARAPSLLPLPRPSWLRFRWRTCTMCLAAPTPGRCDAVFL